jgi:hypothetical protein
VPACHSGIIGPFAHNFHRPRYFDKYALAVAVSGNVGLRDTLYAYWKEKRWLEKDARYFHDNVRWNLFKDLVPRLTGWITGRQVDKAIAKVA